MDKENKQDEKLALLIKIVRKLEWSRLYWRGHELQQIFVCPICCGVEPRTYDNILSKEDSFLWVEEYNRGHRHYCEYLKI